ncbi:excalibur calcium-binding domain-containing protein [Leptolyngbya sp. FACHB-36]|uniref:excalibur calcium-binding domain-containing protein n=1 Tax=Leptolyngbya sp. FACHB-36 TaxID=2692808 RepID=UPI0018EFBB6F|nr:excalibur calcium-binding domain-containing protein [Leptolyngbya sp. FACHB-36]
MKWFVSFLIGLTIVAAFTFLPQTAQSASCDPSYPTVCIAPAPPDLDCKDITYQNFQVKQPDPHRFDRDKDGIGCESK